MITTLTIASLSPFMVADAQDKAAEMPQDSVVAYDWSSQNAVEHVDENDLNTGLRASSSFIAGSHQIDDWNLA